VLKVGDTKPERVDIRVVAATNRDLEAEMRTGNFREDLYYRLNVINVHLPPLRGRGDDIVVLAKYLLHKYAEELGGKVSALKQRFLFSALFSAGCLIPIGFEFGFRKPLHVIRTTPADWEVTDIDLRSYITKVNAIKKAHDVFHEESPTNLLQCNNPNVLLMWKASVKHKDEALLILNKDSWHHQDFYTDHFRHFIQSGKPLHDVSPEYPLDYIHEPFHYGLRPGQGIVLVTSRT
jgi:hypothetical protein